jgi:hypothetical protein
VFDDTMKWRVNLRKTMVVLAIAFALGGSALSTSAFARSGFGNGHPAGNYAYDSDRVGNSHRGLLQKNGRGYERDPWGQRGYSQGDPWGHWGAYYGPMF